MLNPEILTQGRILPAGTRWPQKTAESKEDPRPPVAGDKAVQTRKRMPDRPSANQARHPERFATLNAFVDGSMAGLPHLAKVCWFILFRDTRNGVASTAMTDMARRAGCDKRSVIRAVKRLEEEGFVEVVRRGGKFRGVSVYRMSAVSPCMVTKLAGSG